MFYLILAWQIWTDLMWDRDASNITFFSKIKFFAFVSFMHSPLHLLNEHFDI